MLATDLQLGLGNAQTAGLLVLATLVIGLLAGWYPSRYLSAFSPSAVLKGSVSASQRGVVLRGVLVVFQFAIVIVLMVAAAVIQLQLRHADQIDVGFRSSNVIAINTYGEDMENQYATFRDMLLQSAAVTAVVSSDASPLRDANQSMSTFQVDGDSIPRLLSTMRVSAN